jgi:hypothetical protein
MDSEFASIIGQWQSFENLAGSISATLLGLLFIAASIRPALFDRAEHREFLTIAAKSLGMFILVIAIALVFLIPNIDPRNMGITLAGMAILALVNTTQQIVAMQKLLNEWGLLFITRRILLPAAGYVLLLWVSAMLYIGQSGWISWLGPAQILFILSATYNAWDLLLRVGTQEDNSS